MRQDIALGAESHLQGQRIKRRAVRKEGTFNCELITGRLVQYQSLVWKVMLQSWIWTA